MTIEQQAILGSNRLKTGKIVMPRVACNYRGMRIEMTNPNPDTTRLIPLTKGKFAIVDADDYERLNPWKWHYSSKGYATRSLPTGNRGTISMHRVIAGTPIGGITDHANGNKLDNRKENLRVCTKADNCRNSKIPKNNTSGYKGVNWHNQRKRWVAAIVVGYKRISLGTHECPRAAARAYDAAARKHHGEFAFVNFPETQS